MSSFSDAVSLEAQPAYSDSPEFDKLNSDISDTLFLLNNNLVTLGRLLKAAQNTNGKRDVVERAIDLADESRDRFKTTGEEVKRLQSWEDTNAAQRFTQQKLSREFGSALAEFQQIQKRLAAHEKQEIKHDKQAALEEEARGEPSSQYRSQEQQQDLMTADFMSQTEADQHMTLISEREEEIRNIEQGIEELNEIFSDLGTIVTQQGTIVGEYLWIIDQIMIHQGLQSHKNPQLPLTQTISNPTCTPLLEKHAALLANLIEQHGTRAGRDLDNAACFSSWSLFSQSFFWR